MALIMHSNMPNENTYMAFIAAEYCGVEIEVVMNTSGKVPVLETPDGPLFESKDMARYVARLNECNPINGTSYVEYVLIDQWIHYLSSEIEQNITRLLYPRLGFPVYLPPKTYLRANLQAEEAAIEALKRGFAALNTHLANSAYIVGNSLTLADIIATCILSMGFSKVTSKSFTAEFPHVERYFWTMVEQPNFKKILGEVNQTDTVPPLPMEEAHMPNHTVHLLPMGEFRPSGKNPLDNLPPSKMLIDEWKRLYSNTKTNFREVAIKGFWEMYDPEGYSLWFCDYKYNEENTVSFVTLNKVSGFLQRMELARRHAFGKMLVIGGEAPYKVKGLWLFRGSEIPSFVIEECYDVELYDWVKVDVNDEDQKERVNQMMEDHEPFDGEPILDAKCFK